MRKRSVRNHPADTKVNGEGGGGDCPGARAKILLQPLERTTVKHVAPLQPREWTMVKQISTLQPMEDPHAKAGEYFLKELWPMESPCWSRFILQDCRLWEGPMLQQGKCEEEGT